MPFLQFKIVASIRCFQRKFVYYFAQNIIHLQNGRYRKSAANVHPLLLSPATSGAGLFI